MLKKIFKDNRGASLIEVMVASAILIFSALAISTFFSQQNKHSKILGNKLDIIDIKSSLIYQLKNPTYCKCLFNGLTFDVGAKTFSAMPTTFPRGFDNTPLPCTPSTTSILPAVGNEIQNTGIILSSVSVPSSETTASSINPGEYNSVIQFNFTSPNYGLKPISINFTFYIDTTAPGCPNSGTCDFKACVSDTDRPKEKFYFGGAFGTTPPGFTNPATGVTNCPSNYSSVSISGVTGTDYGASICFWHSRDGSEPQPSNYYAYGGMFSYTFDNPYTGGQSCPAVASSSFRIMGLSGTDYDLYVCYTNLGSNEPTNSNSKPFGGFFSIGDKNMPFSTNPLTGSASCPPGFTPRQVYGVAGTDYPIFICYKP